jgi:hypothetical protein
MIVGGFHAPAGFTRGYFLRFLRASRRLLA